MARREAGGGQKEEAAGGDENEMRRSARPRHEGERPAQAPAICETLGRDALVDFDRGERQHGLGRQVRAGRAQRPARQHRLRERQRRGPAAGGAENGDGLGKPREPGARRQGLGEAGFGDGAPERLGEGPGFGRGQEGRRPLAREEAVGGGVDEAVGHRRPRPRAMMPRRISRVPPRKVKEGALSTASASSSSSASLAPARRRPGATRRTTSGISRSKALPRSLTSAASRLGVAPACSMPATESDMRRKVQRCAARRPSAAAARGSGSAPSRRTSSMSRRIVLRKRSGPLRSKASSLVTCRQPSAASPTSIADGPKTLSKTTSLNFVTLAWLWIAGSERPRAARSMTSWLSPAWRSSPAGEVINRAIM